MLRKANRIAAGLLLLALAACGTTNRFIEQPQLTINGSEKDAQQAATDLFDLATPFTIKLCEADLSSKECKNGSDGISASGVGGLFLPLALHVTGMTVSKQSQSVDGWAVDASLHSKVDGISPLCQTAHGQIIARDNNTLALQLRHFYCNWVVVGNVIVNADLSIDHIDPKGKVFTGFYKVTFYGTGNAAGSGYYKAAIVRKT